MNAARNITPAANVSNVQGTPVLATKAMLVALQISSWGNRKFDRTVSQHVEDTYQVTKEWGAYNKRLIAKQAMKAIGTAISRARAAHYENTLPWLDNGQRILPSANYFPYINEQRARKEEFEKALDELCADWDKYVEEARQRLGQLFNDRDYPNVAKLRAKFSMEVFFAPLPAADDFRVSLNEQEVDTIRQNIEARTRQAFDGAVRDLWERIYTGVVDVRDRLKAYHVDEETLKVQHPFRDSLMLHLRELVHLLPRLNVTGDRRLQEMADTLAKTLVVHKPQDLRDDPQQRAEAIKTADDILAAMAGYVG